MDIERLNKFQIVLLTLLVSFITSIATGIVTVALMEQAPPVIPQTINRVVERTIERVVPHETQTATVITTEKTIVVKESDLVAQAIARVRPSVVRVHMMTAEGKAGDFLSRGFVIADGYALASIKNAIADSTVAVSISDKTISATIVKVDSVNNIVLLALTETKDAHTPSAVMGKDPITLGQTIIAVTGSARAKVATGLVTSIDESKLESGEISQASFDVDIPSGSLVVGSPLLNTDGAVIGMFNEVHIVSTLAFTALIKSLKLSDGKTTASVSTTTKPE